MAKKKIILILCYVFFALSNYVLADEIDGFRGLKWGEPLPKEGMTFIGKGKGHGGIDTYVRKEDNLKIGSAELESIVYLFWHGKFCGVAIESSKIANYLPLLYAFTEKFGKPVQPNQFLKEFYWLDNTGNIFLGLNSITNKTNVVMASKAIQLEQQNWDKEQAKKGKNDF